jgi:hypothetical protein
MSFTFENHSDERRTLGTPASAYTYALVDADGAEVTLPHRATAWDGSEYVIDSFKPSRFHGNVGYLYTVGPKGHETLVPSVFKLKIIAKEI